MRQSNEGYQTNVACRVANIPARQIDIWCWNGLATPSIRGATHRHGTRGGLARLWSFSDLLRIKVFADLYRAGVRTPLLMRVRDELQRRGVEVSAAPLIIQDGDVLLETPDGPISTMRQPGQGVLMYLAYDLAAAEQTIRDALDALAA